jgi:hypothetical protein
LVEALDQLGDREAARELLTGAIEELRGVVAEKEAEEAAGGAVKPSEDDEVPRERLPRGVGGGGMRERLGCGASAPARARFRGTRMHAPSKGVAGC